MPKCLSSLPQNLQRTDELNLLTFLSCVGMLMNGDYVSYKEMEVLIPMLAIPQAQLQKLQILSNCCLPRICPFVVWKLHQDIPHRLLNVKPMTSKTGVKRKEPHEDFQMMEVLQEVVLEDLPQVPPVNIVRTYNMRTSIKWTPMEDAIIPLKDNQSAKLAYLDYCKACQDNGISTRTFTGFWKRRANLQKLLLSKPSTSAF